MNDEEKRYKLGDPVFQALLRRKKDVILVFFGVLLGIFFEWGIAEVVIFSVFIWSIIGPIPSRYLAWFSIFFLCLTPILLVLGRKGQAEEFAIYAYYFLVMTAICGIIEVRKNFGDPSDVQ